MPSKKKKGRLSKELFRVHNFSVTLELLLLALILIFAFYLRIGFLSAPSFWVDESISSIASLNILEKGVPVFDSGVFYGRALVFHYSQALSMLVFGANDFSARLPSVIFGCLTVLLAYLVGREYNRKAGLFAAAVCSAFFLEVFFSKQARFYQLFQLAFFSALFFLYKSRKDSRFLLPAVLSFLVAVDTQPAGLFLAPFFIGHILLFNLKKWFYALVPIISLIFEQVSAFSIISKSNLIGIDEAGKQSAILLYLADYIEFTANMKILLFLFIPGIIWSFFKKKDLTFLMVIPALLLLIGLPFLETFAFRYAYFFVFVVVLYSGVLFGLLCEKFSTTKEYWPIVFAFLLLIIVPSNLLAPISYTTMLVPSENNFNDFSAPEIDYKSVPAEYSSALKEENAKILALYSPPVEWYFKKPDYVFAFSMTGKGTDAISYLNPDLNKLVDVYSGAGIIDSRPSGEFYFVGDAFSSSKLKPNQQEQLNAILADCNDLYRNATVVIKKCD